MHVLSDRNWFSTLAYQGARGEVSQQEIIDTTAYSLPDEYMYPDLAYVLTIDGKIRRARQAVVGHKDGALDAFEKQNDDFHDAVSAIYDDTVTTMGAVGINGAKPIDDIHQEMVGHLESLLKHDLP